MALGSGRAEGAADHWPASGVHVVRLERCRYQVVVAGGRAGRTAKQQSAIRRTAGACRRRGSSTERLTSFAAQSGRRLAASAWSDTWRWISRVNHLLPTGERPARDIQGRREGRCERDFGDFGSAKSGLAARCPLPSSALDKSARVVVRLFLRGHYAPPKRKSRRLAATLGRRAPWAGWLCRPASIAGGGASSMAGSRLAAAAPARQPPADGRDVAVEGAAACVLA